MEIRPHLASYDFTSLLDRIKTQASRLGFAQIGVSDVDLSEAEPRLLEWLNKGFHGEMHYMQAHGVKRTRPNELVPGTVRVISARMNYAPSSEGWLDSELQRANDASAAVVSIYARGRDYHKVMRSRLQQLADYIQTQVGVFHHRVFTDSAPVMEVEHARKSGIGWRGKHTVLLNRQGGSFFFLGELFVDFPLPIDKPTDTHCGSCTRCIDVCPTQAIVAPYVLDARRCISYLTIEHPGSIPVEFRPLLGNRIYGCDDCQTICPWNSFAQHTQVGDFSPRNHLDNASLLELWAWSEEDFLQRTEGSAIRRIGYQRWLRNLAVALGNALRITSDNSFTHALSGRADHSSSLVREHVAWAMSQNK
jgi:epoxyqueuosine reductase